MGEATTLDQYIGDCLYWSRQTDLPGEKQFFAEAIEYAKAN